jgi:hypothetical protein
MFSFVISKTILPKLHQKEMNYSIMYSNRARAYMMTVRRQVFFLLSSGLICCLLSSCSAHRSEGENSLVPVTIETSKKFSPRSINEIVVLPFEPGLGQKISDADLSDAERDLVRSVQFNTSLTVRNASDPAGVTKTIAKYIPRRGTAREQAVYVGRDLGVQGILYGVLSNYTELEGSSLGSDRPAAVSCTLWLVDASTGEVVWSSRFADTERPLFENIFRWRRKLTSGVGNKTASELLDAGFQESLRRLESERAAR